jgi:hypothetical protein
MHRLNPSRRVAQTGYRARRSTLKVQVLVVACTGLPVLLQDYRMHVSLQRSCESGCSHIRTMEQNPHALPAASRNPRARSALCNDMSPSTRPRSAEIVAGWIAS